MFEFNKGHSQEVINGDIKASWLLTGVPLLGMETTLLLPALPVHLGEEHLWP